MISAIFNGGKNLVPKYYSGKAKMLVEQLFPFRGIIIKVVTFLQTTKTQNSNNSVNLLGRVHR